MTEGEEPRERYVTAREVAERMGLSADTILRYYREGRIPGRRMPGHDPAGAVPVERGRGGVGLPAASSTLIDGPRGVTRAARADSAQAERVVGDPLARRRGPLISGETTGYRTKAEGRNALEEELRRVRLGPLHRPQKTLRELMEAYVAQYDAAPSSVAFLVQRAAGAGAVR